MNQGRGCDFRCWRKTVSIMSRYHLSDRNHLRLRSGSERGHDLSWTECLPLKVPNQPYEHPEFADLLARVASALRADRPVILMMRAHAI
jgi:pimeloyl-ACP methyl ester carboxylesterase